MAWGGQRHGGLQVQGGWSGGERDRAKTGRKHGASHQLSGEAIPAGLRLAAEKPKEAWEAEAEGHSGGQVGTCCRAWRATAGLGRCFPGEELAQEVLSGVMMSLHLHFEEVTLGTTQGVVPDALSLQV